MELASSVTPGPVALSIAKPSNCEPAEPAAKTIPLWASALISTTGVVPVCVGAVVASNLTFVLSAGRSLASVIVPCTLNVIVDSPLAAEATLTFAELLACSVFAASIALLSEPGPESLNVLTVVE
jgi:hypothetical protein